MPEPAITRERRAHLDDESPSTGTVRHRNARDSPKGCVMQQVHAGIELDGTRATVVSMSDGSVVDIKTFTEASTEAALAQALATLRAGDPVRITLLTEGVTARRIDLTSATLDRAEFESLTYATTGLPREGTTVAGLFFDVAGLHTGQLGVGLAAVAPAEPVTALYRSLGQRHVEIVPDVFTSGALEGLSLALRHTSADLTLVQDGYPVAYTQLAAGGLAKVAAVLGGGTEAGPQRLRDALATGAPGDPLAAREVERYLRSVLTEVTDTAAAWVRMGERVSSSIYLHGPGASARILNVLLSDHALSRAEQPDVEAALTAVPPRDRAAVVGAFLNARTFGHDLPQAVFPDPEKVRRARNTYRRTVRRRRRRTFTAAAVIVSTGLFAPIAIGAGQAYIAKADASSTGRTLSTLGAQGRSARDYADLNAAMSDLGQRSPYSSVIQAVYRSAPAGLHIGSLTINNQKSDLLVTVTGSAGAGSADPLTSFTAELRATLHPHDLVPGSEAATANGETTFAVTFTIPGGAR